MSDTKQQSQEQQRIAHWVEELRRDVARYQADPSTGNAQVLAVTARLVHLLLTPPWEE